MNEHDQLEQRAAIEEQTGDVLTDLAEQVLIFADYAPHDVVVMNDQHVRDILATNFGAFLKEHWESIRFEELRADFQEMIDLGNDGIEDEDESN